MKRTSEICKIVGVSKRTLQFYDDEGLINVERSENNYRLYDRKELESLWEIMIYKEMGLGLKEIKQLLSMSEIEKKEYFKGQMKKIEGKISTLRGQMKFISMILTQGLPQIPEESSGTTYISRITELRKKCVCE